MGCEFKLGSFADCATAFLALCAFGFSVFEYCRYKKRERTNLLTQLSERYTTNSDIGTVVKYLEALEDHNENTLALPDIHQLEMFMRFSEELCCLLKSKALKENIVYYMFGHYVLVFEKEKNKWPKELGYDKEYWYLFRDFVNIMKKSHDELFKCKDDNNKIKEYKINIKKIRL